MRTLRIFVLATTLFGCAAEPGLSFVGGNGDRNLGTAQITEQETTNFVVVNSSEAPLTIHGLYLQHGWGGVFAIDAASTSCAPEQRLAAGERCAIGIVFEPGNDVTYRDALQIDYGGDEGLRHAVLRLRGLGVLNCSLRPEFAASFAHGESEEEARIVRDIDAAQAAGESLTADDGFEEGFAAAHARAYDGAYDDAFSEGASDGYNDAYNDAYDGAGYEACAQGDEDGYLDGFDAGYADGEEDGFYDGDAAGYEDGFYDGALDGEADSCFVEKVDLDPSLPGKCEDQGFASVYSQEHYRQAFLAAAAANEAYQEGLARGEDEGAVEGQAQGESDGYLDGYEAGAEQGTADGNADQYDACYAPAVAEGYDDAYYEAYAVSFDDAYISIYSVGYEDGYVAGSLSC